MSIFELDEKVKQLRDLHDLEAEVKAEIASIEDAIKAEMLAKNTETLKGDNCTVNWKTFVTTRFDSAAFKLSHAALFSQYTKATTRRRLVIT